MTTVCCLYCGKDFAEGVITNMDHMDPLDLRGWDHPDNLLQCCQTCNLKKKNLAFVQWLERLDEPFRKNSRAIYIEKHCYSPEDFFAMTKEDRTVAIKVGGFANEKDYQELIEDLSKKKAEGCLSELDALKAISGYLKTYDPNRRQPSESKPAIDSKACQWACEYYMDSDTPDEEWWYRERWYAYCEI